MQWWKTREWKIAAPYCRGGKRESSQYGKPHFDDTRRALHERKFFYVICRMYLKTKFPIVQILDAVVDTVQDTDDLAASHY